MLVQYDLLIQYLRDIVEENLYCEDGELRIKNKLKYDVVNLLDAVDKEYMKKLYKELEYND